MAPPAEPPPAVPPPAVPPPAVPVFVGPPPGDAGLNVHAPNVRALVAKKRARRRARRGKNKGGENRRGENNTVSCGGGNDPERSTLPPRFPMFHSGPTAFSEPTHPQRPLAAAPGFQDG